MTTPKHPPEGHKRKPVFKQKPEENPSEGIDSQPVDILDSLKASEIEEVIQASAEEAARNYAADGSGNYDECVLVVNMALTLTGNAVGGKLGAEMVKGSQAISQKVCRQYFP